MGLDVSHGCWSGPYSQFMRWRIWLAGQIGLPLGLMECFMELVPDETEIRLTDWTQRADSQWEARKCVHDVIRAAAYGTPIPWSIINNPLVPLLHHSDCDGKIRWWDCGKIAIRLGQLLRTIPRDATDSTTARGCYDGMWMATKRFALGCAKAYKAREDVKFH